MRQEPLQIEAGLRWYALRTKVNRERDVERRLNDLGLEVFLPWMRARRRIGSRFQWVLAPLFPGYVFCRRVLRRGGDVVRRRTRRRFTWLGRRAPHRLLFLAATCQGQSDCCKQGGAFHKFTSKGTAASER